MTLEVLYEDNHLLAVVKPAGLLVQGDQTGDVCLVDLAGDYRKQHEAKPGNVFVGLVHRIDRPVSGLVLLAKTSKGASRLSEQFRERQVRKLYLAVCEPPGRLAIPVGTRQMWEDRLARPGISGQEKAGKIQSAKTVAEIRAADHGLALVALEPLTGRKHQLRAQTSKRRWPIVGDRRYGSNRPFGGALALHSLALAFLHPTKKEPMLLVAPPPASWKEFGFSRELFRPGLDFAVPASNGPNEPE